MSQISTGEARKNLAEIINKVAYAKERITLTRRGKSMVAVVPAEDVLLLEALENRLDLAEFRAGKLAADTEGTISWEEVKKALKL